MLSSIPSFPHSGRTDSKGGHHDRKNGGYHYHHGKPAHQHPNGVCELEMHKKTQPQKIQSVNEDQKNTNWLNYGIVGALSFGAGFYIKRIMKKLQK